MTRHTTSQLPLSLRKGHKHDVRVQFGALCYRVEAGKLQFLLITSRETRRWIIPKGWPMDATTPSDSALTEAYEEAGVSGRSHDVCVGVFGYTKKIDKTIRFDCLVMVYPVRVKRLMKDFPEAGQRKRKWLTRKKAAARVDEPALRRIIMDFDPALLR